jgi:heat-inducible transcriptional repressor
MYDQRQLRDERAASFRGAIALNERQQSVLRAVVEDYVLTAVPVGSKTLVQRHRLGVSSATIRSAMAELEALGLLSHPHTSAGRVPSDLGYRVYVESLMREAQLDRADELMIRHQFQQVQLTSNEWLRLAASILAGTTRSASVVTPARSRRARFGHLQLVQLADQARLAVLVLADGNVVQRRLERAPLDRLSAQTPIGQEELDAVAMTFNAELTGLAAPAVRRRTAKQGPLHALVGQTVASLLEESDSAAVEEVITDGLANVLEQPEFAQGSKLRGVLEVLQRSDFFEQLIPVLARRQGVHVIIGRENSIDAMHEVSLVFATYGEPDQALGMLGVLGPTRMPYPRAIPTVRYLSNLMNELITSQHETHD